MPSPHAQTKLRNIPNFFTPRTLSFLERHDEAHMAQRVRTYLWNQLNLHRPDPSRDYLTRANEPLYVYYLGGLVTFTSAYFSSPITLSYVNPTKRPLL